MCLQKNKKALYINAVAMLLCLMCCSVSLLRVRYVARLLVCDIDISLGQYSLPLHIGVHTHHGRSSLDQDPEAKVA